MACFLASSESSDLLLDQIDNYTKDVGQKEV